MRYILTIIITLSLISNNICHASSFLAPPGVSLRDKLPKLNNIQVDWQTPEKPEWGSALRCCNVNNLEINGFTGRQSNNSDKPAIWLKDVKGAYIHNCHSPSGTGTFIKLDAGTADVSLIGNDLSYSKKMCSIEPGVKKKSVFISGNRKPGR